MHINEDIHIKRAYRAMILFLEEYYSLTKSDDIGALLGSMSFDPTVYVEWVEVVNKSLAESVIISEPYEVDPATINRIPDRCNWNDVCKMYKEIREYNPWFVMCEKCRIIYAE